MTDHERGAYSPQTEAPLAFDARQSQPGKGFPTTLVMSLVVLVVLIVALVLFYRSGIKGASDGAAPVGTPVAQIKAPAPNGSQPSDEAAGLQIYKTEAGPSAAPLVAPTFAPPPEQPQARPTTPVTVKPASPAQAAASGVTVAAKPAKPAARTDEIGAILDRSTAPAVRPAPAASAVPGATSVQIGAYSSETLAAKGWSDLAGAFAADMSGKGKHFEPVTKDGKTLYRAAVTGFSSKAQASAFCGKLKAAGHACIVK